MDSNLQHIPEPNNSNMAPNELRSIPSLDKSTNGRKEFYTMTDLTEMWMQGITTVTELLTGKFEELRRRIRNLEDRISELEELIE